MTFTLTDIPADLADQTHYEGLIIPLYSLYRQIAAKGGQAISGKTFTRCRIDGPSVLLALGGVDFDRCFLGEAEGDVRNLLLKPMARDKVTGAIPVGNCRFVECNFFSMGFTGGDEFLNHFQTVAGDQGKRP